MKTEVDKAFDAVKFMREQRRMLSENLFNMTKEEILKYFKDKENKTTIRPSA